MSEKGDPWAAYPKTLDIADHEIEYLREYVAQRTRRVGECIEWIGQTNVGGRGIVNLPREGRPARRSYYAYRVTWFLAHGHIPHTIEVCHSCDNPLCVNVQHLFLGDHVQNMRDMVDKGRHGVSNFTMAFRLDAVAEWDSGRWESRRALARHLGIWHTTLNKWIDGKHVAFPELRNRPKVAS